MSPLAPAILIFEKAPRWESELKRRTGDRKLLVRPCRGAADVADLCRQIPGSVVVIDLAAGAAAGLQLLETLARLRLVVFPLVIGARDVAELEWPARELGAADFIADSIGGAALADICRRMLAV